MQHALVMQAAFVDPLDTVGFESISYVCICMSLQMFMS
jgi:hypothetical protein